MVQGTGGVVDRVRHAESLRLIAAAAKLAREGASGSAAESKGAKRGGKKGDPRLVVDERAAMEPQLMVQAFLDIRMVATMFGVHRKTIETWIRTAGLPCLRLGGVRRFDYEDVIRWASARKEGS